MNHSENFLISIIILNWNGKKFLEECFKSLERQSYKSFEMILIDNGSTDDSVDFIRKNFPKIKIIENRKNLGFAKGNNQGFDIAKGEYIFTLNNDTRVDPRCLEKLVCAIQNDKKIGIYAPKILSWQPPYRIDSVGMNIYFDGVSRGRGRMELDHGQYNRMEEILFPSACAALYKKEMLNEIGFFDEDFFAYCEDTDLGLRARLAGWKAIYVPSAIIYHYYSGTVGKYSPMKVFFVTRNHIWVAFKNFPLNILVIAPFYSVLRYVLHFFGILKRRGAASKFTSNYSIFYMFYIIIKSYFFAFIYLFPILKKRKIIQQKRKIRSKDFSKLLKNHRLTAKEVAFLD